MTCTWTDHEKVSTKFCPECGDQMDSAPVRIQTRAQLVEIAARLGVRPDWHEPDEQDLTAEVEGWTFDNAGFWPNAICSEHMIASETPELCVKLRQDGKPVAVVNLATLFAMACGTVV